MSTNKDIFTSKVKTKFIDFENDYLKTLSENTSSNTKPIVKKSVEDKIEILPLKDGLKKYTRLLGKDISNLDPNDNGLFIYIPKSTSLNSPLEILTITDSKDKILKTQNIIFIDSNSSIDIIVKFSSPETENKSLIANSTNVYVKDNSSLNYLRIIDCNEHTNILLKENFYLYENAKVEYVDIVTGANKILQHSNINLLKDFCEFNLNGSIVTNKEQIFEINQVLRSVGKSTFGQIKYNNILNDYSKILFNGLINIEESAEFSNSRLEDNTIMLSPNTIADSIPSLEIKANEVKASHGATVSNIDEATLLYTLSRGINKEEARQTILEGFISTTTDKIKYNTIKEEIFNKIKLKINNG